MALDTTQVPEMKWKDFPLKIRLAFLALIIGIPLALIALVAFLVITLTPSAEEQANVDISKQLYKQELRLAENVNQAKVIDACVQRKPIIIDLVHANGSGKASTAILTCMPYGITGNSVQITTNYTQ